MSGYDDEQREQEDILWPWLASDVMADGYEDAHGESYSWQNTAFDDSVEHDREYDSESRYAGEDHPDEFDVAEGL